MAIKEPEPSDDLRRLDVAMRSAHRKLKAFRQERLESLRQYVGKHYGEDGAPDRVPLNLIELAISTYQQQIAARNPRVLVSTPYRELLPGAADLQLAVNYRLGQMQIDRDLNAVGIDALFGIGVLKVGLDADGLGAEEAGTLTDPGDVWVQPVGINDWVMDMSARSLDELSFCGNRYRVDYEWAKENPIFSKSARNSLRPSVLGQHSDDESEDSDPNQLSRGDGDYEGYSDHIDLWDIWLPRKKQLVTFADGFLREPLRVVDWEGPPGGPYHILGFGRVPGNVMPLAPVQMWMDLHLLINRLFNKVARQAERQKTVLGVSDAAVEDGKKLVNANDGDAITMSDPSAAKEFRTGGADQSATGLVVYLRDMFSYFAGNLDAIGGLGAQSQTVGQDKLLIASASQRVQAMQSTMNRFVKGVVTDIAWYMWNDPLIRLPLSKKIPGTDIDIHFQWPVDFNGHDRRMGELFHYNFDIEPYSMAASTPSERLNKLIQLTMNVIVPVAQMGGASIDVERFLKAIGELSPDLPELKHMIVFPQGEQEPPRKPVSDGQGMPNNTTRTYVRENRPAGTRQGKDQALAAHLMGLSQQPAEMAGVVR